MVADHKQQNWPVSGNTLLKFPLKKWVNKLASYVHILRKEPGGEVMLGTSEMGNVQLLNKPGSLLPRNKNLLKKLAPIF